MRRSDEIICLSDSDDCVVIQNEESSKRNQEPENCTDSDEDIIYIPAPAPEVINIDADDTNDKSNKNKSPSHCSSNPNDQVQMPESTVSNDFLDNNSVDSAANFNFSLHGADFNAQSNDFVRPLNPVENCETESSCSTNDQSREISNSVKTIVFDEVEFPREDIFADKSLESFKTFITPQRKSDAQSTPLRRSKTQSTQKKKHITTTATSSSDSSSESDYETGSNCNQFENLKSKKNLPSLSLMQPQNKPSLTKEITENLENTEPLSEDCNKRQPFNESIKVLNKSRKRRLQSSEVDTTVKDGKDICDSQNSDQDTLGENQAQSSKKQDTSKSIVEVETEGTPEISTKTQPADESINMSNKSRKKRLQSTVFDNDKDGEDVGESQKSESHTLCENKVQSKKKQVSSDDVEEAVITITSTPKSTKKRKSKKSENEDSFMSQVIVIDEIEDTEVKTSAKKKKKRKSGSTIPEISILREMIDEIDSVEEDLEKVAVQDASGADLKLANCVSRTQQDDINQNRFLDKSLVDVTDFDLESIQRTQSGMNFKFDLFFKNKVIITIHKKILVVGIASPEWLFYCDLQFYNLTS